MKNVIISLSVSHQQAIIDIFPFFNLLNRAIFLLLGEVISFFLDLEEGRKISLVAWTNAFCDKIHILALHSFLLIISDLLAPIQAHKWPVLCNCYKNFHLFIKTFSSSQY